MTLCDRKTLQQLICYPLRYNLGFLISPDLMKFFAVFLVAVARAGSLSALHSRHWLSPSSDIHHVR
jgi:hypothetical protein